MAKRIVWTDQAKTDIRSIEQTVAIQILKTLGPLRSYRRRRNQTIQGRHSPHDSTARSGPSHLLSRA